jgi:glycosyltransferase involved in cell wall biosynthesis
MTGVGPIAVESDDKVSSVPGRRRAGATAPRTAPRRLLIVSHVHHYEHRGELGAYGPYAREIDIWADLFEDVVIAAPLRRAAFPGDAVPFTRANISIRPQRDAGGDTLVAKLGLLAAVPVWTVSLALAMRDADAVHVRCPGNLGLIGAAVAPLFSRCLVAKYAGQWNGYAGESIPTRLQRFLLRSRWWHGPVTVYGEWPDQPAHVVPFFTSMMTAAQVERAGQVAAGRRITAPLRVLFSGTLESRKRVDALIDAVAMLAAENLPIELVIVGDGPQGPALRARAGELVGRGTVSFQGAMPYDQSLRWFEWAHCLVLPSQHSEGWPKVIAEGMCHGLLCVAVAHGQLPRMLTGRGVLLATGSPAEIAAALRTMAGDPDGCLPAMRAAAEWARQYSLERRGARAGRRAAVVSGRPGVSMNGRGRIGVLHLTDTLEPGGTERVAVNLVNALPRDRFEVSICSTRRDGPLSALLGSDVKHLSLGRRHTVDVAAMLRLRTFIRTHEVRILHAHATALFTALGGSFGPPYPRVVWHDHCGHQQHAPRSPRPYRLAARRVAGVISVNEYLADWARTELGVPGDRVWYVPNFVSDQQPGALAGLPGSPGTRLVCVANLRPQKAHVDLLNALAIVIRTTPAAHLLLVGREAEPAYAQDVRRTISELGLASHVTMLGERTDVASILRQCDIGVLSSIGEGFPLALVEYGLAGLAAVTTTVGQCAEVLDDGHAGILVPPGQPEALAGALSRLLASSATRVELGDRLRQRVSTRYGRDSVIERIAQVYDAVSQQH